MSESPRPPDSSPDDGLDTATERTSTGREAPEPDERVVIAVVRTGGIAGIRRRWHVEPGPADAPQWIALIERCPWDEKPDGQVGADRFVWSIRAHTPAERREREVPDAELAGPWRELVDAVRAAKDRPDDAT